MKNKEILSAVIGGAFFAVPYLVLSAPMVPSILIGAAAFGYFGIILGAIFAGGVYIIVSIIIKFIGIKWVDKLLPPG